MIGKGGDMIKRIGSAAREELERFFGTRGSFSISTCASKAEWREDDRMLGEFGLGARDESLGRVSGR